MTQGRRKAGSAGSVRSSAASVAGPRATVGELYRGHLRMRVIDQIAKGELSYRDIADQLDLQVSDIAMFADDHAREITEVRTALAKAVALDTAGLWIAKKRNRLAEYQDDVEAANSRLSGCHDPRFYGQLIRAKHNALKAVAEELGISLAAGDEDPDANVVHYVLEADEKTQEALR